mgnify:CR=1 FL=1
MTEGAALTVGQVAERFGVTVRTLHHYDEIGLVRPHRTASGYRVYTDDDLDQVISDARSQMIAIACS